MFRPAISQPCRLATTLVVAITFLSCDSANIIGPDNQLEVGTAANNFQFQVSNLENVTQELNYAWQNTGPQATINVSQAITAGSVMLTITDAEGTVVHQAELRQDDDTDTAVGVEGEWLIELRLEGVTGTFNFTVQRTT